VLASGVLEKARIEDGTRGILPIKRITPQIMTKYRYFCECNKCLRVKETKTVHNQMDVGEKQPRCTLLSFII
jgi:hypothetical protein